MGKKQSRKNRQFKNLSETPPFAEGYNYFDLFRIFMNRPKDLQPHDPVPSIKTDLKKFHSKEPAIVWFGHSSYLIHHDGLNFLIDPVLSGHASPFSFMAKAFPGSDVFKAHDMPEIHFLILTHNHYDHLDYKALKKLAPAAGQIVLPLRVTDDLKGISFSQKDVKELGWWDSAQLADGISITSTPARHFSGRGLRRNRSLWTSYVLQLPGYRIFIGGDSGYDAHFREIGTKFGPFDIAILECGQYNDMWPYIHSTPEEAVIAAKALDAQAVLPVHWGKFALSNHGWKEPIQRFVEAADKENMEYATPRIGEPVVIGTPYPKHQWWE